MNEELYTKVLIFLLSRDMFDLKIDVLGHELKDKNIT